MNCWGFFVKTRKVTLIFPALVVLLLSMAGCGQMPASPVAGQVVGTPWALQSRESADAASAVPLNEAAAPWRHYALPGKATSKFAYVRKDGRDAMGVTALSSASMLRRRIRIEPEALSRVKFSWKVPELIAQADMALREADDSPVRVILVFEGDRQRFSAKNAALSELALALTGEELPYATLMYVWCNKRPVGSVIINPRTDRIRKLVVESGSKRLDEWLDYERDIRADYEKAFGEPPGALTGIGIMTDSDNTHTNTAAWYGPVRLSTLARSRR